MKPAKKPGARSGQSPASLLLPGFIGNRPGFWADPGLMGSLSAKLLRSRLERAVLTEQRYASSLGVLLIGLTAVRFA